MEVLALLKRGVGGPVAALLARGVEERVPNAAAAVGQAYTPPGQESL